MCSSDYNYGKEIGVGSFGGKANWNRSMVRPQRGKLTAHGSKWRQRMLMLRKEHELLKVII